MASTIPANFTVKSLSPAYWYVCSAERAMRERGRGQVGRAYGSRLEAERAAARFTLTEKQMVCEFADLLRG